MLNQSLTEERKGRGGKGTAESQEAEQGCLFGVTELSSPTGVRLPQLYAPGTAGKEAEFVLPKGVRAHTHAHTCYTSTHMHGQPQGPKHSVFAQAWTGLFCFPSCWLGWGHISGKLSYGKWEEEAESR